MNVGAVIVGALFVFVGGYTLYEPRDLRGLRVTGIDTDEIDPDDHPKAVRNNVISGLLVVLLGIGTVLWGLFN